MLQCQPAGLSTTPHPPTPQPHATGGGLGGGVATPTPLLPQTGRSPLQYPRVNRPPVTNNMSGRLPLSYCSSLSSLFLNPQAAPKFGGCQKVFRTSSSLTLPSSLSSQEMPSWQRSAFLETDETNSKPLKSEPDVTVVDEISSGCNLQYLIIIECNAPDHTSYWYSVDTIADTVQQTIRRMRQRDTPSKMHPTIHRVCKELVFYKLSVNHHCHCLCYRALNSQHSPDLNFCSENAWKWLWDVVLVLGLHSFISITIVVWTYLNPFLAV